MVESLMRFKVVWTFKKPVVAVVGFDVFDVLLPSEVAVWKIVLNMANPRLVCKAPKTHGHAQCYVVSA